MTDSAAPQLFIVSTPIGHPDDITQRAIDVLKSVDLVLCEEYKEGSKLLKRLGIKKKLKALNEHNEADQVIELMPTLESGESIALISDCGTPVFADPGQQLIAAALNYGYQTIPVPGASSLMASLACSNFDISQFYYAGFLPRNPKQRQNMLKRLKTFHVPIVLYDAPYRLKPLLQDMLKVFGQQRNVMVAFNLTLPNEHFQRGTLKSVAAYVEQHPQKSEFVIILDRP